MAEVIGDNTMLERLDLRDNDIRVAGLMALSLAHRVSHHLFRLDIKRNVRVDQVCSVAVRCFGCCYLLLFVSIPSSLVVCCSLCCVVETMPSVFVHPPNNLLYQSFFQRDAELVKNFFRDIDRYSQRNKMEHEEREARKVVLKRQQELEDQKKQEEEQQEAERRSEALAALSTALHAQALAEGQGLPRMPRLDEAEEEGENGDSDHDRNLLLDRPQPVGEELEMEDKVENKEVNEMRDESETVQLEEGRTRDVLETESTDIQSEETQQDLNNHVDGPSLTDELSLYSLADSSVNGGNAVMVAGNGLLNTENSEHSELVEDDIDQSPGVDTNGDNSKANS